MVSILYIGFFSFLSIVLFLIVMQKLVINRVSNSYLTHSDPTHLIVIQHGFLAPWIRGTLFAKRLVSMASTKHSMDPNKRYLIHMIRSNSDDYVFGWYRTQDGIHRGGQRTCDEIKSILDAHQSIKCISLIGQSLGGLYMRYAIKQLYDENTGKLNGRVDAVNFVTLASPHLGADDWFKHRQSTLFHAAKYLSNFGLLPNSLNQLLRLDGNQGLLYQMASDEEYLKPLRSFKNRVIYANAVNDNRVSCSSGLMLPSFDYHDEEGLIKEMYREDIETSQEEKLSFVRQILNGNVDGDTEMTEGNSSLNLHEISKMLERRRNTEKSQSHLNTASNEWFNALSESMEWKRFVVTMNTGFLDKKFAHGLVANPVPQYGPCGPMLNHFEHNFQW